MLAGQTLYPLEPEKTDYHFLFLQDEREALKHTLLTLPIREREADLKIQTGKLYICSYYFQQSRVTIPHCRGGVMGNNSVQDSFDTDS